MKANRFINYDDDEEAGKYPNEDENIMKNSIKFYSNNKKKVIKKKS